MSSSTLYLKIAQSLTAFIIFLALIECYILFTEMNKLYVDIHEEIADFNAHTNSAWQMMFEWKGKKNEEGNKCVLFDFLGSVVEISSNYKSIDIECSNKYNLINVYEYFLRIYHINVRFLKNSYAFHFLHSYNV